MPQWRDVDVNFRGSGSAFSDATQAAARAGQGFSDLARTLEEQKRYEAEAARQKVLDARATTLFNQQQEDRNRALQQREALLQADQLRGDILNATLQEKAFNDPRYSKALEAYKAAKGPNADITDSISILRDYAPAEQAPVQTTDIDNVPLPAVSERVSTGKTTSLGMSDPQVVQTGTKDVKVRTREGYVDPNATVTFGQGAKGKEVGTKDMPRTGEFEPNRSMMDILNYKGERKPVFGKFATGHGSTSPISLSNLGSNVKAAISENVTRPLAMARKLVDNGTPDYKAVLRHPEQYKPDVLKEALMNTPGMTITRNRPASSVRDTVLNEKGMAFLSKYAKPGKSTRQVHTAKVSDFDTSKMYNKDGSLIDASKSQTSKTGDVFFKDSKGHLVNALTLGKAMQENYHAPTFEIQQKPVYGKVQTSSAADVAQGAPVFKTSKAFVESVAKQTGYTPERIIGTMNSVGDMYKQVIAMLGTDNTEDRNAMKGYMSQIASNLGLTSQEYDVNKAVDSILPSNDLTARQQAVANVILKEIDDIRQDKRWAQEDKWKEMEMAFKEKQFEWTKRMDQAGLSLKRQEIAKKDGGVLPPGHTLVKDKKGDLVPVLTSTAQYAEKLGLDASTPKGQAELRALDNKEYQDYVTRNDNWFSSPKYKSPEEWKNAGRPWKD